MLSKRLQGSGISLVEDCRKVSSLRCLRASIERHQSQIRQIRNEEVPRTMCVQNGNGSGQVTDRIGDNRLGHTGCAEIRGAQKIICTTPYDIECIIIKSFIRRNVVFYLTQHTGTGKSRVFIGQPAGRTANCKIMKRQSQIRCQKLHRYRAIGIAAVEIGKRR